MEFVVDKMALGQVSLQFIQFFPLSLIPALFHMHSCFLLSVSFHPFSICSRIISGLDSGPISGCSSPEIVCPLHNNITIYSSKENFKNGEIPV
jgi:hypothetical protein